MKDFAYQQECAAYIQLQLDGECSQQVDGGRAQCPGLL